MWEETGDTGDTGGTAHAWTSDAVALKWQCYLLHLCAAMKIKIYVFEMNILTLIFGRNEWPSDCLPWHERCPYLYITANRLSLKVMVWRHYWETLSQTLLLKKNYNFGWMNYKKVICIIWMARSETQFNCVHRKSLNIRKFPSVTIDITFPHK